MVNVEDVYAPKYLKAADLPPRPVKYVIEDAHTETFKDNTTKVVLSLKGEKKGFVVNVTNAGILASMFGKETDDWKVYQDITMALMPESWDYVYELLGHNTN